MTQPAAGAAAAANAGAAALAQKLSDCVALRFLSFLFFHFVVAPRRATLDLGLLRYFPRQIRLPPHFLLVFNIS